MTTLPPKTIRHAAALVIALMVACGVLLDFSVGTAQSYGSISGRVTNENGQPIDDVTIVFYKFRVNVEQPEGRWEIYKHAATNADGVYTRGVLTTGTYRIGFAAKSNNYFNEYYNDQASRDDAEDIYVTEDSNLTGYDAVLAESGRVEGKVVDRDNLPIQGITVSAIRAKDNSTSYSDPATTDADGNFMVHLKHDDPYFLRFEDNQRRFVTEFYDNQLGSAEAELITLGPNEVRNVAVSMNRFRTIYGVVTDNSGTPLEDVRVGLEISDGVGWGQIGSLYTSADGTYTFHDLDADKYRLSFSSPYHVYTVSNDGEATDLSGPDSPESVEVNVSLTPYGQITGRVTDASGAPVYPGEVALYYLKDESEPNNWVYRWAESIESDGTYQLVIATPQAYRLEFIAYNFFSEFYNDAATVEDAETITVHHEDMITNIDVELTAIPSDDESVGALAVHASDMALVNFPVSFQATDGPGDDDSFAWDFGDGNAASGPAVSHTYKVPGHYVVKLTGRNGTSARTVTHEVVVVAHALRLPQLAR